MMISKMADLIASTCSQEDANTSSQQATYIQVANRRHIQVASKGHTQAASKIPQAKCQTALKLALVLRSYGP